MKAIQTKYHGPTDRRGSRITATAGSNRVTLSFDYELDSDGNHDAAALALCAKMGWTHHHLMRGTLEDARHKSLGNVYTFEDSDNRVKIGPARRLRLEDRPDKASAERCDCCGRKILDAEYMATEEGTVRHLNACPA